MPHLTFNLGPNLAPTGPVMNIFVGVSQPRAIALRGAGHPIPPPALIRGLIDTGASCTSVDLTILNQLGIPISGTAPVHTPSTQANQPHIANLYDVSIVLTHPLITRTFNAVPVTESQINHQGIQALIGRDILAWCLFSYDGSAGIFTLAF